VCDRGSLLSRSGTMLFGLFSSLRYPLFAGVYF
jgi:hypothetical protein